MENFYPKKRVAPILQMILPIRYSDYAKKIISLCAFFIAAQLFISSNLSAQQHDFSYSYLNITRGNGGGTLEPLDIIEVRALVKVNVTTNNFYYIDTIRTGTQYVTNSLKILTNEGLTFKGPYTNAANDDNGVYATTGGIGRLRVNLGVGASFPDNTLANFGVTTGGGTVTAGTDLPKFYGTTLFIVSYRLLVTASEGDTIRLTGNYYYDSSKIKRNFRFNYPGIKIIKNQALCNNFSSASFTADSSFKSGNIQNRALPAIVPGYIKVNLSASGPQDNYYSIVNNTSANGTTNNAGPYNPNPARVFGLWDIIGDHTGATNPAAGNPPTPLGQTGGYMLVVNANYPTGEVYRDTIKDVCPNTYYEFSSWIRNICGKCGIDQNSVQTFTPGVLPNLSYAINDVDYYTTGNILYDQKWQKRGFIYKTGPTETQFRITIKNNAPGGGGNDWVLDDIKLATCYPNLIMNPSDTASTCKGWPLHLSDTVKSFFDNYTNYCWQKSTNGKTWTSTGVCGTKIPKLENGFWVYVVDTVFTTVAADSGTYYRLKVATSGPNLANAKCAVDNSQKVFLKVFSAACSLLDSKLLNFNGSLVNNKSVLKWTSKNEENLVEYQVEKGGDGTNFTVAGIVAAVNDANGASYSFNDPEEISGTAYYRLRLITKDVNDNKYSKTIVIYNNNAPFRISTINPFKNNLKLEIAVPSGGQMEISLFDMYGKIVSKKILQATKGNSNVDMDDISKLASGMYILRVQFNGQMIQNKLFKTN
jgi:hypothetical protein